MKECGKRGKEGGIYATRKRRGARPTRVPRSGGRQTRLGKHLKVNNIKKKGGGRGLIWGICI